jgi:hypothetical protein
MLKLISLLIAMMFLSSSSFCQTNSLTGKLNDVSEKKPVANAVVALLTPVDSFLYKFTRTDNEGNFSIKNIQAGNYILMTTHNRYADYLDGITIKENENSLGSIALINKTKLLQEVIIKTGSAIRIKGDTTIYTADSFKVSANANVEELLKKMPGIQVDKNGTIKAMGEKVEKVLVDGEEFFGDDPGLAVKNLRADAVKEVQVFDKKSDQAEFTGIDDGNSQKTINLKLKDNKKRGYFGKIDAAGGPVKSIDPRYNSNILLSSFKGKRKLSAFVLNGNTGQDQLSWEDREKFGSDNDNVSMNMDDDGNVNYVWTGGDNDEEPYIDNENGFMKNTNTGLQYSNKWNDKQTLNISPKYNTQSYTNTNNRFTQTQIGDTALNENATNTKYINRNNFKFNASLDSKIDSTNSIKFTTKTSLYHTKSNEVNNAFTTGDKSILKNRSDRNFNAEIDKSSFFGSVLFKHKFAKARRTFSINSSWSVLNTDGNSILKSTNESYNKGNLSSIQNINQQRLSDEVKENISANIVYTEPLSKQHSLELSHQITTTKGSNNRRIYSYNYTTGFYDVLVDSLSNLFKQTITINKPNIKINYNAKKIKYTIGSGFGFTQFDLLDKSFNKNYKRSFTNFFPAASFTYTYKPNHSLRINYNGNTAQPSLNDLQPIRNNADFFNQFVGNPNLKPSFTNSLRISHNSYDFLKELSFYQGASIRSTNNLITYSRITDLDSGKTTTKPVNTNGNFSGSIYVSVWYKIKKLNLQVGVNPSINYNKSINIINNNNNTATGINTSISLYLSKSKEKKYDFNLSNQFGSNSNNTTQNNIRKKFNTNNLSIDATVYYKEKWSISTDYNFNARQKTPEFQTNLTNQMWNARLKRTFKNDEFTAYIMVRDILNQNIGIQRNFYDNTITEERNDRLKRYGMIGFIWNFKNKAAAKK